jgi:hypothetical protein
MVLFITSYCCGCSNPSHIDKALWYKYSEKYIQCDDLILENKAKSAEEGLKLLHEREAIVQSILSTDQPDNAVLKKMIASQNTTEIKIALVNIMLRDAIDLDLSKLIINILGSSKDISIKFYAYHCLQGLKKDEVNNFKSEIVRIIDSEEEDGIIIIAIPVLAEVDSELIAPLFIKYLSVGSPIVKKVAYIYFSKIEEKYQKIISKAVDE